MRNIYLIRHGKPESEKKICLSSTDLPLSMVGRLQGVLLADCLKEIPLTAVYASGLRRAIETAQFLPGTVNSRIELNELGVGDWEGLTFSEIQEKWPEIYEARGRDPFHVVMPGGEAPADCQIRFDNAIKQILDETDGDIAIVAHAGANRLFLTKLMGADEHAFLTIPQPYGGINHLVFDGQTLQAKEIGYVPHPELSDALCEQLMETAGATERIRKHCYAVAKKATQLVNTCQKDADAGLIYRAALLHDIARSKKDHARIGAEWIRMLGYEPEAELIAQHHDPQPDLSMEAAILYLADKMVAEDREVSIKERFAKSREKCTTPEAIAAHERRYQQAIEIHKRVFGEEIK